MGRAHFAVLQRFQPISQSPAPSQVAIWGVVFRSGLVRRCLLAIAFLTFILAAAHARAQDNYEIQVYGSDLIDPGHTMVELHSNFTIDGSKAIVDGVYPTNHADVARNSVES